MILNQIVFTALFLRLLSADQSLQCGDWNAFKDEKCYKVFNNKDLQSYSDARNMCHQNEGSTLVSIESRKVQEFMFSLLRDVYKTVNDVWIGAEYRQNNLKWINNVTVNYTNWANGYPVNESGYECVNIVLEEPLHGKWHNVLCNKNNVVVCEKSQNWLFSYLQSTVMELRKSHDIMAQQLESTKVELKSTQTDFLNTKIELNNTKTKHENNKLEFEQTKLYLENQITKRAIESTPPGSVAYFTNTTVPLGWLKANGQSVSRITYANLFASIGTTFGSGDGSTTFTLPDLRGEFIRGWSDGRDVDNDRTFGSFQWGSSIPSIDVVNDSASSAVATGFQAYWQFAGNTFDDGYESYIYSGQSRDGIVLPNPENTFVHYIEAPNKGVVHKWNLLKGTRPRNIALLACIKY